MFISMEHVFITLGGYLGECKDSDTGSQVLFRVIWRLLCIGAVCVFAWYILGCVRGKFMSHCSLGNALRLSSSAAPGTSTQGFCHNLNF